MNRSIGEKTKAKTCHILRRRKETAHRTAEQESNEATATQIVAAILDTYFAEFQALRTKLERLKQEESA